MQDSKTSKPTASLANPKRTRVDSLDQLTAPAPENPESTRAA